jgi:putative ABC transport system permease protein
MLRLAWRNLIRRRLRSLLTLLGVAISMSVVVALLGMADGGEESLNRALTTHRGDMLITARGARFTGRLTPKDLEAVTAVPGVARALPYAILSNVEVRVPTRDKPIRVAVLAMPDPAVIARKFGVKEGRPPAAGALETLLGVVAAKELNIGVNGHVLIREQKVVVAGIYDTGIAFQDRGLVMPLASARTLLNLGANSSLAMADVEAGEDPAAVAERINAAVKTVDARPSGEIVQTWEGRAVMQGLLWAITCIALLAGGVGVLNTMTMSVLERTREIGLLLAVGWPASRVRWLIIWEGGLLAFFGGLAGWGLGIAWVAIAQAAAAQLTIEGAFGPSLFAMTCGMSIGIGVIGGLIPAFTASRMDPVEALRYE